MSSQSAPVRSQDVRVDTRSWVREGILAGVVGAAAIAIVFLGIDIANGRPLWTPHALGTALFHDALAPPDAKISAALVCGYTVVHGWVFVAVALQAAFMLSGHRLPGEHLWMRVLVMAGLLFVGLGVVLFAFFLLREPDAARPLGIGWLVLSNAIAALVMATTLVTRLNRIGLEAPNAVSHRTDGLPASVDPRGAG